MWVWQEDDWPRFRWSEEALSGPVALARSAQSRLASATRFLREEDRRKALAEILVMDGVETSAIEGEALDPESVRSSVARQLGLPEAGLRGPEDKVVGLVEMLLDATQKHIEPLTQGRLCAWQAALFPTGRSGLRKVVTGDLRGEEPMRVVSGPDGKEKVHFEAVPRDRLEDELQAFLDWFADPPPDLDGMLRAGLAHLWFETVHPFEDGNGRVGRAVADMALAQADGSPMRLYSLSSQLKQVRDAYYDQLEAAQRGDLDVTGWLLWFVEQVQAAVETAEKTVENTLWKSRFWLHHSDSGFNERQRKALNRMLDLGPGGFEGGMTNRKYRNLTKASAPTATRDLKELVDKGALVAKGSGRGASYELVIPDPD